MFRSRHFRALRDGLSMEGQRQDRHTRRLERRRHREKAGEDGGKSGAGQSGCQGQCWSWVRVGQKAGYC